MTKFFTRNIDFLMFENYKKRSCTNYKYTHIYIWTQMTLLFIILCLNWLCHRKVTHFQFRKFNLESADRLFVWEFCFFLQMSNFGFNLLAFNLLCSISLRIFRFFFLFRFLSFPFTCSWKSDVYLDLEILMVFVLEISTDF